MFPKSFRKITSKDPTHWLKPSSGNNFWIVLKCQNANCIIAKACSEPFKVLPPQVPKPRAVSAY